MITIAVNMIIMINGSINDNNSDKYNIDDADGVRMIMIIMSIRSDDISNDYDQHSYAVVSIMISLKITFMK